MNFMLKFLFAIFIIRIKNAKCYYACSNFFFIENRTLEIINCVSENFNLTFECRVKSDQKIKNNFYDSIISNLIIYPNKNDLNFNSSIFKWRKTHGSNYSAENYIRLTKESNSYFAKLILYKIQHKAKYEICAGILNTDINNLCCHIEKLEAEEQSIFMSLIVIVIVFIINFVVVIVFWKCPPSAFNSLDEMLEKLPTSHVKKLKKLLLEDRSDNDVVQNEDISDKNIPYKNRRRKNLKNITFDENVNQKVVERVNPAFDEEESETDSVNHIEYDLRLEAQKLRRFSRISLDSIKLDHNDSIKPVKKKLGVKFADQNDEIILTMNDEVENLRKKVITENKRRTSIKPFKKAFNLDISSESSDYSD